MKITKLIAQLEEIQKQYGDLKCCEIFYEKTDRFELLKYACVQIDSNSKIQEKVVIFV